MESFSNLPTAADYAQSSARDANRKAEQALTKAQETEKKIEEIHTGITALLLGTFGEEKARHWINEAREFNRQGKT